MQTIFSTIDPAISGTALAGVLDDFKNSLMTNLSGTTRPTELDLGGGWIDLTNDPTYWSYRIWTGTDDVEVFRIYIATGLSSVALAVEEFSIKKITADTAGALLKLIKQRIATNGQVLSGDTIGEIQFIGRTDTSTNPVVAKMVWVSSDNMTTSAYGGEFAFYSVADNTATLVKHMRFVDSLMETLVPLKINSLRLVSQNVATSATIAQLSADNPIVEMTGATATDIQGIKSDDDSRVVTIHNRSSVNVTLKHQNGSATAVDRMKLPASLDYVIIPDASATLYYCTTDGRWKLKSTAEKNLFGFTKETFYGPYNSWTAPSSTTEVRVNAYKKMAGMESKVMGLIDSYSGAYAWGLNTNGQLGVGDVTPRSSPVAVLGGLNFLRKWGDNSNAVFNIGLASTGSLYAWGVNTNGGLGLGDVTPRSSPVVVLGGFRYNWAWLKQRSAWGAVTSNLVYAWGLNDNGQLGVGDVTPRSSPVAVLGAQRFSKIAPIASTGVSVVGMNLDGAAYAWGINNNGQLGVGDVSARSSPVAVLGGITFTDVAGGGTGGNIYYLGLNTAGAAYAWGDNQNGQLGLGDVASRSSPVVVLGGLTFKQIIPAQDGLSSFGLTSTGVAYAWGLNTQGYLGVGDVVPRSSPVAVAGGFTFVRLRNFGSMAYGITADGTMYAWGSNVHGQLGVGDVTSRSSPVAVLGGLKFFDVFQSGGFNDSLGVFGVTVDGTLYAWGRNTEGTLGLGDVTPRSSPVAVLGGFRADTQETSYSANLTVTPSTAYIVSLNAGISSFGNQSLGAGVYKVEIEYLQ